MHTHTHTPLCPVCSRSHPLSSAHSLVSPSFHSCICHVSIHTRFLTAHPFIYLPSLFPLLTLHNLSLTHSPITSTFSPFIRSSTQTSSGTVFVFTSLQPQPQVASPYHRSSRESVLGLSALRTGRSRNHSSTAGRGTRFIISPKCPDRF